MNATAVLDLILRLSTFCDFFDVITNKPCSDQFKALCMNDTIDLIKMFDSGFRTPSGMLNGNIMDLGNFDECLSVKAVVEDLEISGKYCLSHFSYSFFQSITAVCIPNQCTVQNIASVLNQIDNDISLNPLHCQDSESGFEWTTGDWIMIGFFAVIGIVMLASTIYDVIIHNQGKEPIRCLIIFSVFTNFRKLVTTTKNPDHLHCLNGIRAISMAWVIAGHRYVMFGAPGFPVDNHVDAIEWRDGKKSFYIQGARVSVDTFFFLSAFLVSYMFFKSMNKKPLTVRRIPGFYLHRILRILPAMAVLYFLHITILAHFVSGPMWPVAFNFLKKSCEDHWWSFFLYVQNYVNFDDMCIVPTWYLSADMQMFLLSPLILIPLGDLYKKKGSRFVYVTIVVLIVLSIIGPMVVDLYRKGTFNEYETHQRLSVYMIGFYMGFFTYDQDKKKIGIKQVLNIPIWILMFIVMMGIIVDYTNVYDAHFERFKFTIFVSLSRPAWCFGLCWVIYNCISGRGGIVNWFLSRPMWQVVARLSYSMYLLHMSVIMISLGAIRNTVHFTDYNAMYMWCGDFMFTFVIAIFWVLAFESPMIGIEKLIFGIGKPKQTLQSNSI